MGYHVVPSRGDWAIKRSGSNFTLGNFTTQAKAIEQGKTLAKIAKSELVIHRRNGQIRERSSYGKDPYPPAG